MGATVWGAQWRSQCRETARCILVINRHPKAVMNSKLLILKQCCNIRVPRRRSASGWGKNQPRGRAARLKGQAYITNNRSKHLAPGDFDTPHDECWCDVGTVDNDADHYQDLFLGQGGSSHQRAAIRHPPEQCNPRTEISVGNLVPQKRLTPSVAIAGCLP